jgi:hypothetical protein
MPRYVFRIGEAFPADDPIARFVTVLAMIHNDWLRSMTFMQESVEQHPEEGQGIRLMLARQQFAHYHEATTFINESRGHYHPDIDDFIASLDDVARAQYDEVMAPLAKVEQWLSDHRDVTFHYPWLIREKYEAGVEPVANALVAASDVEGTITVGETKASVRFGFADEVGVQLVGLFENRHLVKALSAARIALGEFVCAAMQRYGNGLDAGIVRTEP